MYPSVTDWVRMVDVEVTAGAAGPLGCFADGSCYCVKTWSGPLEVWGDEEYLLNHTRSIIVG